MRSERTPRSGKGRVLPLLAALLLPFGAEAASAQILTGRIVEAEGRGGIPEAFVELRDGRRVRGGPHATPPEGLETTCEGGAALFPSC